MFPYLGAPYVMGSKPPQPRKGQQSFPFQSLPHHAGNGREKGGAPEKRRRKWRFGMGSESSQTEKGTHYFPFQSLPHYAGNGREKSGAVRL